MIDHPSLAQNILLKSEASHFTIKSNSVLLQ